MTFAVVTQPYTMSNPSLRWKKITELREYCLSLERAELDLVLLSQLQALGKDVLNQHQVRSRLVLSTYNFTLRESAFAVRSDIAISQYLRAFIFASLGWF